MPRLAPASLRHHAIPPPRLRFPSRMARVLAVIAPLRRLVSPARTQQSDTTLWARLRYRFVGPEGNRAVAVAGEPGNPLVAYVGAASGGIRKTEDGGVHWRAVFDSQPAQAIGAVAVASSAHNVLWAGTGETFFIRSTTALGNGVYRSTDGGRSWQHQGLDGTGRIARIVIHPANPDVVLVCALGRAYGPAQDRGVYRTTDGGKTWTRVLFVDPNTGCSDLALDPGDPNTIFAGMWQFEVKTWHLQSGGPGSGLWVSRDGGATWTRITGHGLPDARHVVGKVAVAVAPSNPNTVYALIEDQDPTLYRSDDRGTTWHVVSHDHSMAERAPYYVRFAVAPDDEERLYFVSVRFSMSRDGGRTLARSGYEGGGDNHDIWIDPLNPDRFMVAHDGGVSITLNRGRTFMRVVLPIAQMYHVHVTSDGGASWKVVSPDLTRNDTSHQQSSGGVTTDNLMTFDGATLFALAESPAQAGVIWAGSNDGLVHVTRDGATTWTDVTGNLPKLAPWGKISNIEPSRFDAGTAYISVDLHELDDLDPYIFKTTDFGRSWKRISEGLPRSSLGFVHVVREDPTRRGMLFAGTESGVYVTLDDGGHWAPLQSNLPLAPISWITVQPHFHDLVVATYVRGLWILDGISPLEDPAFAALPARAVLHRAARELGPRSLAAGTTGAAGQLPGAAHGRRQRGDRRDAHATARRAQGPQHRGERRGRSGADPAGARHSGGAGQRGADDQPPRVGAEA